MTEKREVLGCLQPRVKYVDEGLETLRVLYVNVIKDS